ncbi:protein SDA1 [Nematocida homosporus]|uniref:protein SDA1 n=1 Tax=Nematocida homosporus TaxID=1912981 RepID=UPI0022206DB7|nr:protein SDA1 [Nematocida homosporus]KAI5185388.1 protein SDA1 [Nematocida homosporus]
MDIRLQLQIKKDPKSYADLYRNEVDKLRGMIKISKLDPAARNPELCSLLVFLPHISSHFEDSIAGDIFSYTLDYYSLLDKSMAHSAITSITTLKKTKQIGPEIFYKQAIPLVEEMDKRTKTVFIQFLIAEMIRDSEHWGLIKEILLQAVKSGVEAHAKRAAYIFMHMVSRGAWMDSESAEIVFKLVLDSPSVVVGFVFMYLLDKVELVVKEEDIEIPDEKNKRSKIKRETSADKRKQAKAKKELQKKLEAKKERLENKEPNIVLLLQQIEDKGPSYGAKIFKRIKTSNHSSDIKLQMAQVVSRIACYYQITIKGFLGYMLRFMFPHQEKLPQVFAAIAQSIHEETPSKEVEAICNSIVEHFCSDYKDDEVIAYGINSLRAIIKRYPEASKYACINHVLDYRRTGKARAVTASHSLKKMLKEAAKAATKLTPAASLPEEAMESDSSEDLPYKERLADEAHLYCEGLSNDGNSDTEEESLEESIDSENEDPNGFVTEEAISKIRKKATKEEMIEKAKADKHQRKQKDLPSTNREKQKETNYTVRKTKRKAIGKKLSKSVKRRR